MKYETSEASNTRFLQAKIAWPHLDAPSLRHSAENHRGAIISITRKAHRPVAENRVMLPPSLSCISQERKSSDCSHAI